eukprot:5328978-Pleurochrysis_carterae.AAC.1
MAASVNGGNDGERAGDSNGGGAGGGAADDALAGSCSGHRSGCAIAAKSSESCVIDLDLEPEIGATAPA